MSSETVNQEETKPQVNEFEIRSISGELLYTTTQQELDDCFYNILSLMSWTKTFTIGNKVKLTFSTITDKTKHELLKSVQTWADENKASANMFDSYLNKVNLAHYLSYIEMNNSAINLREKSVNDRIEFLGENAEDALKFYGTYQFVFIEIVRKSLLNQINLKNS